MQERRTRVITRRRAGREPISRDHERSRTWRRRPWPALSVDRRSPWASMRGRSRSPPEEACGTGVTHGLPGSRGRGPPRCASRVHARCPENLQVGGGEREGSRRAGATGGGGVVGAPPHHAPPPVPEPQSGGAREGRGRRSLRAARMAPTSSTTRSEPFSSRMCSLRQQGRPHDHCWSEQFLQARSLGLLRARSLGLLRAGLLRAGCLRLLGARLLGARSLGLLGAGLLGAGSLGLLRAGLLGAGGRRLDRRRIGGGRRRRIGRGRCRRVGDDRCRGRTVVGTEEEPWSVPSGQRWRAPSARWWSVLSAGS